jgi:two-component system chemotaxis sensor kinase CheA
VRNAVAHGIEPAAERRAAGKPAEGRVEVKVARRGRRVRLTCRDDGRGIDVDAVRRAARRRGRDGDAAAGEAEIIDLLLHGGLTTSAAVTEVSGRGVGLDVVREAAERLGGAAIVETETGVGTTVGLDVPLSFAAFTALTVEAGGRRALVPLDGVRRVLPAAAADRARFEGGEVLVHGGRALPLVDLAVVLGVPAARSGSARLAVVVGGDTGRAAVAVDRLRGTATIVARPLPEGAEASAVVAGVWLDPAGRPQLVLDPDGLVAAAVGARAPEVEEAPPPLPVLIVDDSLTTRMLEQSILQSAGYEVVMASSAEEGLEVASQRAFGLFLVDVEMPGMDGYTFVARTRAEPDLCDVPAIMVTSCSSPEDLRRSAEAGASDHIVKGEFDQGRLLGRIRELIRTRPAEEVAVP